VATFEGAIVATSGLSVVERPPYAACPSGKAGIISGMYTLPAFRRQGLSRDLLLRLLDSARALGVDVAQVTASDMGVLLYENCGFTPNANFRQRRL
jgi:GNAT superfamily N-acetyltransferase